MLDKIKHAMSKSASDGLNATTSLLDAEAKLIALHSMTSALCIVLEKIEMSDCRPAARRQFAAAYQIASVVENMAQSAGDDILEALATVYALRGEPEVADDDTQD